MGFNIPSNFVGSWALNAQRTGQIHKAKLCSNSPVTTWTEGIGNFLLALLNFFFPNLEMILTLRWFYSVVHINLCLLETLLYLGDSWRSKSRLKNTTDLFFLCPKKKIHIFSPFGKFYLTPHHHHSTLTHTTETYSTVRHSRGKMSRG